MQTEISFHNTVPIEGNNLREAIKKADKQNDNILEWFQIYYALEFTPCEVHKVFKDTMLLTSVRRSITTLTNNGFLVKTGNKKKGIYGVLTNTWKLK